MSEINQKKFASVHYAQYLQLENILHAQHMRSSDVGQPAHDEMLFIIIHQVYELWFKQIIHETESVCLLFRENHVDERNIGIAVSRLERVIEIQKIMIDQIRVLETMTPLDFLDFRNYLIPASGFQSFQFRKVEVMLGLKKEDRLTYNQKVYSSVFSESQQKELKELEASPSLANLVEQWLNRTPFLDMDDFPFLARYRDAVNQMIEKEEAAIRETTFISEEDKNIRLQMLAGTAQYFKDALDEEKGNQKNEGLSYKATLAALLIHLYRDEPLLRMPHTMLVRLLDIDELFTTWRYRHAQMVLRMLGRKMGTGGSSGHDYL
ncbi:MAG: hypothetical protein KDD54_06780 [Flavobacteriales bacterium]|nr:hypothetical protein [Flavobacteriales bacterium]